MLLVAFLFVLGGFFYLFHFLFCQAQFLLHVQLIFMQLNLSSFMALGILVTVEGTSLVFLLVLFWFPF